MRLAWLRIRFIIRSSLGIRDIRQGILRQRINELEARRSMVQRVRRRLVLRLAGRAVLVAALAVVVWVAINR